MSRPFKLTDAKAGHPVASSTGADVEVLKWDYPLLGLKPVILGLTKEKTFPEICFWDQDGTFDDGPHGVHPCNLVMAPVAQLDGVDIYPGDMLTNSNGETVPVPHGVAFRPEDWKPAYPTTRMTPKDLHENHFAPFDGDAADSCVAVANAAIRHGIDHGYLSANDELCSVINAAVEREQRIARHFINLGAARQYAVSAVALPPGAPFTVDEIKAELAKVKP